MKGRLIVFALYVGKILKALQRPLAISEMVKVKEFFDSGKSVLYAIEYLK